MRSDANNQRGRSFSAVMRRHRGPVIVWLGALAVVVAMLANQTTIIEAPGLVQGRRVQVAPIEAGTLASVDVALLQEVSRGQVLARMDEARLRSEAAVVAAEIEAVRRELELELASYDQEAAADGRSFANDVESSRLEVLEIMAVLEPDRVTLEDLRRNAESYRELLQNELVSMREYERVQANYEAMQRKVTEYSSLLTRARSDLAEAQSRRDDFFNRHGGLASGDEGMAASNVFGARVTALQRQLEAVLIRCDGLALTAPFDGVVTQIAVYPGQVMGAGDAVMTLAEARPEQIVVWLDETSVRRLRKRGDLEATVIQLAGGQQLRAACPVVRVGPCVETMPSELWLAPTQPRRGRPVVLGIPAEMNLVPGARVSVRWG